MFELTIKDEVYQFNFGIGFVREINKTVQKPADGIPGVKEDIGLAYKIGQIISGDVIALVEVLDVANKGQKPRLTRQMIEEHIDDSNTDIDKLFEDVMVFFRTANATKKIMRKMEAAMATDED